MQINEFPELTYLERHPYVDSRGSWQRCWDSADLKEYGHEVALSQVSYSLNLDKGTLRGLHYLNLEAHETKTVSIVEGEVQDIIVDAREASPTYLDHVSRVLRPGSSVTIPPGFAHGFLTLTDHTSLVYLMSAAYSASADRGLRWNDSALSIQWLRGPSKISERDESHPLIHSRL